MKTLHNHIILYDAECPMCNLYTSAFVRNGLLDNREAYQQYSGATLPQSRLAAGRQRNSACESGHRGGDLWRREPAESVRECGAVSGAIVSLETVFMAGK
jgi:predicted DCC family thiol-disulfide oxidoreductase YuxK